MPSAPHPSRLSPEERARRVAEILATGLVRLASSLVPPAPPPDPAEETPRKSPPNELAVSGEKSVTVHAG